MICVAFVDPILFVHSVTLAVYFGWPYVFALGRSPTVLYCCISTVHLGG